LPQVEIHVLKQNTTSLKRRVNVPAVCSDMRAILAGDG
jgi:hypothetical protein